jgi:hypothetical protein
MVLLFILQFLCQSYLSAKLSLLIDKLCLYGTNRCYFYRKNKGQVATKTKCNTPQIQRIKYRKNTGYVASTKTLELDLKTFGFVFECMCIRDLKVYSQSMGGKVSYYHDRYGLEADIVLHLDDQRYALIECKLGSRDIDEGATHLLEMQKLIREKNETEKQMPLREPDLLIVLTGGEIAYTREDGVKVIPLGCLKD